MNGPEQTFLQTQRPTIALLSRVPNTAFWNSIWSAVSEFMQGADVNLIYYSIPWLNSRSTLVTSPRPEVLCGLVDLDFVSGLVIWGPLLNDIRPEERARLLERYRRLPMVSFGSRIEGVPSVLVDNYGGMRQAITHLIEAHGCRRLAYLKGMEGFREHEERYRAYRDVLDEHHLPFDPQLVVGPRDTGPWDHVNGSRAIRLLLDERETTFDAIVSNGDHTLFRFGGLSELQRRGLRVPQDIAVASFDDHAESKYVVPSLTTVPYPKREVARRAAELLLAKMRGEAVPAETFVVSQLIVRQSCGCINLPGQQTSTASATHRTGSGNGTADTVVCNRWQDVVSEAHQVLEARRPGLHDPALAGSVCDLMDAMVAELSGPPLDAENSPFLSRLSEILQGAVLGGQDLAAWQSIILVLRKHLPPGVVQGVERQRAEQLWIHAQILVGRAMEQRMGRQWVERGLETMALDQTNQLLATTVDLEGLADVLVKQLPRLHIRSCYLSLNEGEPAIDIEQDTKSRPDKARLIVAFDEQGRKNLQASERVFPARHLAPQRMFHRSTRYSLIVEPLYYLDETMGMVVFDGDVPNGVIYEALRKQISSALRSIGFYTRAVRAQAEAEKANRLKTRLLANVSHELRTPLNVILGYSRNLLGRLDVDDLVSTDTLNDIHCVSHSAEHQMRLINDLLDLSQAEVDALDLHPEMIDTRAFLEGVFRSMVDSITASSGVKWHLVLPPRLPRIQADPVRLRQILLNLLSNAHKFTDHGEITLGAQVAPPHMHLWVQDTGIGIAPDQQERIFEPFATGDLPQWRREGIGLGLSITRRLVALHGGTMALDSLPGQGSTFHVHLPLPHLGEEPLALPDSTEPVLLLVSTRTGPDVEPAPEVVELSRRQGLEIRFLDSGEAVEHVLDGTHPAALAYDLDAADPCDWGLLWQVCEQPRLRRVPIILYGDGDRTGTTNVVTKPVNEKTLLGVIESLRPPEAVGPVLIVDDEPMTRDLHERLVQRSIPGCQIHTAADGVDAQRVMRGEVPSLVILDLLMPEVDGFELLEWMRSNERTQHVPVLILTGQTLTIEDIERLERHARVALQDKGVLSDDATAATLQRMLFDTALPAYTSALVKRAIAYFHQHYNRPLSRQEVAAVIGASEGHFTRVFRRELGVPPWEYLNRYRIKQAKALLRCSDDKISDVAAQVGFGNLSHFNHTFRKLVGQSPSAYRKQSTCSL